jgi:hypothetical protein
MSPYPPSRRYLLALLMLGLGAGGCLDEELCTSADSTYTCCLRRHATNPALCGASEQEAAEVLRQTVPEKTSGATYRARALAVGGSVTAAATLSSDDEVKLSEKLRTEVEKALKHCAELANEVVNRKRFGGDPTPAQCEEVLGTDTRGKKITRAMKLGEEKHTEALKCAAERLGRLLPGGFHLEQRYRHDAATDHLDLVSAEQRRDLLRKGRSHELKGTLVPDIVIHSGDPLKARAIYDFKFPCLPTGLPRWSVYDEPGDEPGHPYDARTQGSVYEEVFKVIAKRVTPWEII